MSLGHGASIVRNGLVFYFDSANIQKSWKGAPVTNLAKNASNQVDWSVSNLTQTVSRSTITANEVYRITSTTGTGLTFRIGFTNATLVNGATYTVSYRYRIISGGPVFQARDWCDTAITTTTTALGGGIFYETATGTRATYDSTYRFLDFEISNNTVVEIWDLQLEERSFATPYSSAQIRSNTQALIDLTNINTITVDSLTYESNNTFSFNGSSNFMRPNITHSYLSSSCLEAVFRKNTVTGRKYLFGYRHNDGYSWPTIGSMYFTDSTLKASVITASEAYREVSSSLTISANQFYHVCLNKDTSSGLLEIFVNGVSRGSISFNAATYGQWPSAGQFVGANILDIGKSTNNSAGQGWGADFFDGIIPVAKVYNRILTATEIAQNFSAIRGRYGI